MFGLAKASFPTISVAVFFWATSVVSAQPSGIACIKEMTVPVYGGAIWQAQVTGTARVEISLNPNGSPANVTATTDPYPVLGKWLESWFRKASFLPSCGAGPVVLKLIYKLDGAPKAAPDNRIVVRGPDTFEITANPPEPHLIVN
jgi:hypothetical protein